MVGASVVDFNDPDGSVAAYPLPTSFDPLIPDELEYQGQVPTRSQNIQVDDQGAVLFFMVDGRIYNRDGLLIADTEEGVGGASCEDCLLRGRTEVLIVPVTNSCSRFFIITPELYPPDANQVTAKVRYGILDMTLPNVRTAYAAASVPVMGRLLNEEDNAWNDYQWPGTTVLPSSGVPRLREVVDVNSLGALAHMRVGALELTDDRGTLVAFELYDDVTTFLFRQDGVHATGTFPKVLADGNQSVYYDVRDQGNHSARGELELVQVGEQVRMAYSSWVGFPILENGVPVMTTRQQICFWRFGLANIAGPDPALTFTWNADPPMPNPGLYGLDWYPEGNVQFDQFGQAIDEPRISGLEFSPDGRYLFYLKSTHMPSPNHPDYPNEPRSNLGYYDLDAPQGVFPAEGLPFAAPEQTQWIADSHLEFAVLGNGEPRIHCLTNDPVEGYTYLSALKFPNTPDAQNWVQIEKFIPQPAVSDQVVPPVEYRLLSKRVKASTHYQFLQQPICCEEMVRARDRSCNVPAGTYTWSPGSNYFYNESGPIHIATTLRLEAGALVNAADLEFRFAPDAQLVIEPGASFRCEGCTFTNACGERWTGMVLEGTPGQNQGTGSNPPHQGYLELNGCLVANAATGVDVGRSGVYSFNGAQPGGVLIARESHWQNCVHGVRFGPYQNYGATQANPLRNRSRFTLCNFRVDEAYPDELDFRAHADLWRVDGIRFNGCTFENLRNDITESHRLGMGINSLDANYTVRRWCPTEDCGHDDVRSAFTGLDHGIHARTTRKARAFEVEFSDFINNICGVLTEGVVGARMVNNEFVYGNRPGVDLTATIELNWENGHRGMYCVNSYAFDVRDNDLSEDANATNPTEGIVIGYSRGHNDMVFRNSCTGIDAAYVGEGICADPEQKPIVGLQFICNENHNNGYNIWNRLIEDAPVDEQDDHTMRTVQGWEDRPAGNTFDRDDTNLPEESDLHANTILNVVNYRFWGMGTATDPLDIDATFFPKEVATFLPPNNCDLKYPTDDGEPGGGVDGMMAQLNNEKLAYGNTRYLYDQLVDGGSTDEVVQEITGTWPNEVWSLRTYLLSKSPFLSEEALKTMADDGVLPPAIVTEICVANPDATQADGFLKWLEYDCLHPLPGYMLAQIAASWDVRTYRTTLLEQLGRHHAGMTHYTNELLAHYERDTIHDPTDSLRYTWQQLRTPAARYAEAITCLNDGNYTAATAVVQAIPTEHDLRAPQMIERQRMLDLIAFLGGVAGSGRSEAELTLAEQDQLELLVNNAHDRPATWAQNLLCYLYDRCRAWPTGGDGIDYRVYSPLEDQGHNDVVSALQLAPNPATSWCSVGYKVGSGGMVTLDVLDATGRVLWTERPGLVEGQVVVDLRGYAPGSYTVQMSSSGAVLAAQKLMIKQ